MSLRNERLRYFSISLFFLILSQIVAQLFRLVSRIIIARYTNTDLYGEFSVIWNEMLFVGLAVLFGLGQQLTIELPRKDKKEKNHVIYSALFYSIILSMITGLVALILNLVDISSSYKYSLIISAFYVLFLLCQFVLIGIKDFFGIFLLNLIQNSSLLILIAIFRNNLTIENIVYFTAGSILLASISLIVYILLRYRYSIKEINKNKLKIFNFSIRRLYLFIVDIVEGLIIYLLVKLPQILLGSTFAGFTSIAFSIMSFVILLPQIVTIALGPIVSEEYSKDNYIKMHTSFRTSMSIIYMFQGVIVLIFSYFGNNLIELMYGAEYIGGTFSIFYGFLFAIIIDSFTYPLGLYLRNTNHENLFGFGKIISLLTFVAFELLLLFLMKSTLAIPIAYFISKIVLLAFYLFSIIKKNEKFDSIDAGKLLSWFLIIILSFISAIIVNHYLENIYYILLVAVAHIALILIIIPIIKIVNLKSLFINIRSGLFTKKVISED